MRDELHRQGLRKVPGRTVIEIAGKVHEFYANDAQHPMSPAAHAKIKELRQKMEQRGYKPKTEYARHSLEGSAEAKARDVCGHSEKIAIAAALLHTPDGETIRLTKNLRVCGDCHEVR